ncbi:MAG: 6,7-dimethyl-8-ribityllumazine synthase [Actinomycetota bacterium]
MSNEHLRIGIVVSRFNASITKRLLDGAQSALAEAGVLTENVKIVEVPGAFELPGAAQQLISQVDAVITLGAVVRGETEHFTFVAAAAQQGVLRVGLDSGKPVLFGVLTTEDTEQALERSGGDLGNKGEDVARDAIEMANLYQHLGSA